MDSPIRLLIIDENAQDRADLARGLTDLSGSYLVHEAPDGTVGLDLYRTVNPDCVLFDLQMARATGIEVLHELLTQRSGVPVPVIVWTALQWAPLSSAVQLLGTDGYFLKGRTTYEDLDRAIRDAIARSRTGSPG